MATPTERIRRELRGIPSTSELRRMLKHAEEQFMKSWAPKDAEFWSRRVRELKAELGR